MQQGIRKLLFVLFATGPCASVHSTVCVPYNIFAGCPHYHHACLSTLFIAHEFNTGGGQYRTQLPLLSVLLAVVMYLRC